ncbi:MAG: hypothetical protein ACOYEW_10915 [Anaerolineae bacterium]|jgi:hypothetical protein
MKRLALFLVLAVFAVALPMVVLAHTQEDPLRVDLIAGQNMDAGDVLVWNGVENGRAFLQVTYAGKDWCVGETHLHVATSLADIPQTRSGNPIPGQFTYKREGACTPGASIRIPLDNVPVGTVLYIAAHAEVFPMVDGGGSCCGCDPCGDLCSRCDCTGEGETAWGFGPGFSGANWATYFTYTVQ